MLPTHGHGPAVPFTPLHVVDWPDQVIGITLSVVQDPLGNKAAFISRVPFVDRVNGSSACGGMVSTILGAELGSRWDPALVAW